MASAFLSTDIANVQYDVIHFSSISRENKNLKIQLPRAAGRMPQLVTEFSVANVSFSPNAFFASRPGNSQGTPVTGADALLT
jgi:hypothetical protein